MHRLPSIGHTLVISLSTALSALGAVACSGASEQAVIEQFFAASRESDRATLLSVALVAFDPATSGTVTEFSIVSESDERREPLSTQALVQALADAEAEEATFTERKVAYQDEHLAAIQRVLKADAAEVTLEGDDGEIQREWTTFREETAEHAKMVSDARLRLEDVTRLVELSASTPRNPVNGAEATGEIITKDVTISAPVTMGDGQTVQKSLVVTLQRAVISGENEIDGRWIVTAVSDV